MTNLIEYLAQNLRLNNVYDLGLSVDNNKVYLHKSSINQIDDNKKLTVRESRTPRWNPLRNIGVCMPLYVLFCPECVLGLH